MDVRKLLLTHVGLLQLEATLLDALRIHTNTHDALHRIRARTIYLAYNRAK